MILNKKGVNTRAIVCGGDGTVMWVLDLLIKFNVDIDNCPIGIVPFGTGNDFGRVTGWGGDTPSDVLGP
jgi:diacylglycerol kinase (ATP)